jgi:hypothetical protein
MMMGNLSVIHSRFLGIAEINTVRVQDMRPEYNFVSRRTVLFFA